MRVIGMVFGTLLSSVLFAQFDLSSLPAFEHRMYKRITPKGIETAHTYLYRSNDVVRVYHTNGSDANVYSYTVTGKPLEHRKYEKGVLLETVVYDWKTMKIMFDGPIDGKATKVIIDLRPNTVCAYMVAEVFRGFPWGREMTSDFSIFSVEKGRAYFDAVVRVSRKSVPVKTGSGDYTANVVKLLAGIGFIKMEQKYEFYYDVAGTHALVFYDGVDGTDKRLTSSLELFVSK